VPDRLTGAFTTAYFHRPEELRAELAQAGFQVLQIQGLEGAACPFSDFDERWGDPEQQRKLIELADTLGTEPALLGVSVHLLAIARKTMH
jgi:sugar phosphate isomerase/epimerase